MKFLLLIPLLAAIVSCSSTQTSTSPGKYPVIITQKVDGNKLTVFAKITNNTTETISIVDNPNFYSISVRAQDPKKDEVVRPKIVTYGPATSKDVQILTPGTATTLSTTFIMRQVGGGTIEVERLNQLHGPRSFMVISDSTLKTSFSYEHYPRFLTEQAQKKGQNFLTTPLRSQTSIPRPYVPAVAPVSSVAGVSPATTATR